MTNYKSLIELKAEVAKTLLIASSFLLGVLALFDFVFGLYLISLLKVFLIVVLVLRYYQIKKIGYQEKYSHLVVLATLVFIGFNYFNNQGTDGPTIYAAICMFVVIPILFSTKIKWFYVVLTIIVLILLMYFGIDKNNLVIPFYSDSKSQFIDHSAAFVAASIYTMLMVGKVIEFYVKQNSNLLKTQALLEENIERIELEKKHKEDLLNIFAHDVKNPVLSLTQFIELFDSKSLSNDEVNIIMSAMKTRLIDLQGSIDSVIHHIKSGDLNLNNNNILPQELTKKIILIIHYKFEQKEQKLVFKTGEKEIIKEIFNVVADQVSIILKNLLDNAHKYSPEGSTITISLEQSDHKILWSVEDEGEGLSDELQKEIFKKGVTSTKGSGVGLYLCKSIADSIGAELKYIPKKQGSIFQLILNA